MSFVYTSPPQLSAVISHFRQVRDDANAAAVAKWGFTDGTGIELDYTNGTVTFAQPDHQVIGELEVIGSYAPAEKSWMWGIMNQHIPTAFSRASEGLLRMATDKGIEQLSKGTLEIEPELVDELAILGFSYSQAEFQWSTPPGNAVFVLATRGLHRV